MVNQLQKPRVTSKIVGVTSGDNRALVGKMHHGLVDVPLRQLYPVLNLKEVLAFAAAARVLREMSVGALEGLVRDCGDDIYQLFRRVYSSKLDVNIGYGNIHTFGSVWQWINSRESIPDKLKSKYYRLNPYDGKTLEVRLGSVDSSVSNRLFADLTRMPVAEYVFEVEYEERKMVRHGDNYGLVVMEFMPVYPPKDLRKTVNNFALECARILNNYPRTLASSAVPSKATSRRREQLALF